MNQVTLTQEQEQMMKELLSKSRSMTAVGKSYKSELKRDIKSYTDRDMVMLYQGKQQALDMVMNYLLTGEMI